MGWSLQAHLYDVLLQMKGHTPVAEAYSIYLRMFGGSLGETDKNWRH